MLFFLHQHHHAVFLKTRTIMPHLHIICALLGVFFFSILLTKKNTPGGGTQGYKYWVCLGVFLSVKKISNLVSFGLLKLKGVSITFFICSHAFFQPRSLFFSGISLRFQNSLLRFSIFCEHRLSNSQLENTYFAVVNQGLTIYCTNLLVSIDSCLKRISQQAVEMSEFPESRKPQ